MNSDAITDALVSARDTITKATQARPSASAAPVLAAIDAALALPPGRLFHTTHIGHDLKEPLSSMSMAVACLRKMSRDTDPSMTKLLDALERSLSRMTDAVLDVCTLHELAQQGIEWTPRPTMLPEVVRHAASSMDHELRTRGIDITVNVPELSAICDATKTAEALRKMMSAGIKFIGKNGTLAVEGSREGPRVCIRVMADVSLRGYVPPPSSPPISPAWADQAAQTPGLGIALSVAKALTELQGGAFGIDDSATGKRTTWMTLALASADESRGRSKEEQP